MRHFKNFGISRKKQSGAVLLAVMLLLTVILAHTILLNAPTGHFQTKRDQATRQVLTEAKAALIGRAMSDDNIPGSLPCPADTSSDGIAELLVGDNCPVYTGFLPWYTLKLNEPTDDWNAPLFYVLSSSFRDDDSTVPLNSETATGSLSVDSTGDIVAVIFAPGPPLPGQSRTGSLAVSDYLEGTNADGDDTYTQITSDTLNDRLIFITRQELMKAVEWRILGEVKNALQNYYLEHNEYPWLSTFENPESSDFTADPGVRSGHLSAPGFKFNTEIEISWSNVPNSQISVSGDDLNSSDKVELKNGSETVPITSGTCTWTSDGKQLECTGTRSYPSKEYEFKLVFRYPDPVDPADPPNPFSFWDKTIFNPATSTTVATYDLIDDPDYTEISVTITRNYPDLPAGNKVEVTLPTGGPAETLVIGGIRINLTLPEWFIKNEWHHLTYAAISENSVPDATGGGSDLTLTVAQTGITYTNKQVLLVIAGQELSGQNRSGTVTLSDYFEADNAISNDVFTQSYITSTFNDSVRIVVP